jgi:hypothetical protein
MGYFFDGRSSQELAEMLGVSESRISQLRSEALEAMRQGIEAQYRAAPDAEPMGRVARRRANYAAAIGQESSARGRLGGSRSTRPSDHAARAASMPGVDGPDVAASPVAELAGRPLHRPASEREAAALAAAS